MKIKSIKRNEDFVRFSFDVVVQESSALIVTITVCGSLEKLSGTSYVLPYVDDLDWTTIEFLGKPVKYKEFKVMYDKLFKESFTEFEARVDKLAESAIHREIPLSLKSLPKKSVIVLFRSRWKKVHDNPGTYNSNLFWTDWTLCTLAEALGFECDNVSGSRTPNGQEIKYSRRGLLESTVTKILSKI